MSQLEELEQLTRRLAEQLSARLSRRQRSSPHAGRISLRGTIRRNLQHGGEPLHLCFANDVSVNQDWSPFWISAVPWINTACFSCVFCMHYSIFVGWMVSFCTRLTPISEKLKTRAFPDSLRRLAEREEAWSSGTRIGSCLKDFHTRVFPLNASRNTIVLILSDGFETGAPDLLARQLQRFRGRCAR